jgi:hypothetical protein
MGRIIFMALVFTATVAGCNRFPDLTIQIVDVLAAEGQPGQQAQACGYEADQELVLLRGLWDLAYPPGSGETVAYSMVPRIESYIFDNSIATQAPQGNISINTYNVTIKLPDGTVPELSGGLPNPYQVTTSGVIPPSQVFGEVSRGIAGAPMIPGNYASAMVDIINNTGFESIVLELKANGLTAGGFFQQSPSFNWPVELCFGCLGFRCTDEDDVVGQPIGCTPGNDATGAYCGEVVVPEN